MAFKTGGLADKLGNRYERRWDSIAPDATKFVANVHPVSPTDFRRPITFSFITFLFFMGVPSSRVFSLRSDK